MIYILMGLQNERKEPIKLVFELTDNFLKELKNLKPNPEKKELSIACEFLIEHPEYLPHLIFSKGNLLSNLVSYENICRTFSKVLTNITIENGFLKITFHDRESIFISSEEAVHTFAAFTEYYSNNPVMDHILIEEDGQSKVNSFFGVSLMGNTFTELYQYQDNTHFNIDCEDTLIAHRTNTSIQFRSSMNRERTSGKTTLIHFAPFIKLIEKQEQLEEEQKQLEKEKKQFHNTIESYRSKLHTYLTHYETEKKDEWGKKDLNADEKEKKQVCKSLLSTLNNNPFSLDSLKLHLKKCKSKSDSFQLFPSTFYKTLAVYYDELLLLCGRKEELDKNFLGNNKNDKIRTDIRKVFVADYLKYSTLKNNVDTAIDIIDNIDKEIVAIEKTQQTIEKAIRELIPVSKALLEQNDDAIESLENEIENLESALYYLSTSSPIRVKILDKRNKGKERADNPTQDSHNSTIQKMEGASLNSEFTPFEYIKSLMDDNDDYRKSIVLYNKLVELNNIIREQDKKTSQVLGTNLHSLDVNYSLEKNKNRKNLILALSSEAFDNYQNIFKPSPLDITAQTLTKYISTLKMTHDEKTDSSSIDTLKNRIEKSIENNKSHHKILEEISSLLTELKQYINEKEKEYLTSTLKDYAKSHKGVAYLEELEEYYLDFIINNISLPEEYNEEVLLNLFKTVLNTEPSEVTLSSGKKYQITKYKAILVVKKFLEDLHSNSGNLHDEFSNVKIILAGFPEIKEKLERFIGNFKSKTGESSSGGTDDKDTYDTVLNLLSPSITRQAENSNGKNRASSPTEDQTEIIMLNMIRRIREILGYEMDNDIKIKIIKNCWDPFDKKPLLKSHLKKLLPTLTEVVYLHTCNNISQENCRQFSPSKDMDFSLNILRVFFPFIADILKTYKTNSLAEATDLFEKLKIGKLDNEYKVHPIAALAKSPSNRSFSIFARFRSEKNLPEESNSSGIQRESRSREKIRSQHRSLRSARDSGSDG